MARLYQLKSVQKLPAPLEPVWKFFSSPANLLRITPPFLNLKTTSPVEEDIRAGQIITYRVKPLLGIPLSWTTEITEVKPLKRFVDEQKKGPYKLWRHQHFFREIEGGVEMTDVVQYELPFGILGTLAHPVAVKPQLKKIFQYRFYKINELFGEWPGQQTPWLRLEG